MNVLHTCRLSFLKNTAQLILDGVRAIFIDLGKDTIDFRRICARTLLVNKEKIRGRIGPLLLLLMLRKGRVLVDSPDSVVALSGRRFRVEVDLRVTGDLRGHKGYLFLSDLSSFMRSMYSTFGD